MDPEKPVMGSGNGDDLLCPRHSTRVVRLREAGQECVKSIRLRRDQAANLDRSMSGDAWFYAKPFTGVRVFNPPQIIRKQLTELSMYPRQVLDARDGGVEILPGVDELLHVDMRDSLML
jgi:hypothetical protein